MAIPSTTTVIDRTQLKPLLERSFAVGMPFPLKVTGGSMVPFFVSGRDTVFLTQEDPAGLRRGDIVLFERTNGSPVLHRVCRADEKNLYFVGDAQTEIEGPIPRSAVLAVCRSAQRKGKTIQKGDFWWDFFEGPWLAVLPHRRQVIRLYSMLTGKKSI